MSKRIYLSGAITGTEDYMRRFEVAEDRLTAHGYSVVNPAKVNQMLPADTPYEVYMKMSLVMLDMCGAIYLMKDWEKSKGANREYGYALGKHMEIIFEDDVELKLTVSDREG